VTVACVFVSLFARRAFYVFYKPAGSVSKESQAAVGSASDEDSGKPKKSQRVDKTAKANKPRINQVSYLLRCLVCVA
jgi:hypothetical protein